MSVKSAPISIFASLAAIVFASSAMAQGTVKGSSYIPASSVEQPMDIGVRAHTYVQLLAGQGDGRVSPAGGQGPKNGLTPAQVRAAYNLPSTGGSKIIAIVDAYDDPNALADFNTFSAQYGLPQETSTSATAATNKVFQVVYAGGTKPGTDSTGGWELEEALDIEWAHAMAPSAKIVLVEAATNAYANLFAAVDTATNYVDGNGTKVAEVSCSWGGSEFSGETADDVHFTSTSVSYFVSSGDSGSPAHYPSSSPNVVSCGGTTLNTTGAGAFQTEVAWNSSGGGPSTYETTPPYQAGVASRVGAARGTPDVSYVANPTTGVSVYDSYSQTGVAAGWQLVGGTSVSAPSLAGVANVAATSAGSFPAGSQALLTTIYLNLGSSNFRDITSGNNGYASQAGWDFVTGVGSPLGLIGFQKVVAAPSLTAVSPGSATVGSAAITGSVTGAGFLSGATVNWNGTALTTAYVSSTQLTISIPAADLTTAGTASITAVNPGSSNSNSVTFTINNPVPTITSLSPSSAKHGGASFTLTITGTHFLSGSVVAWTSGKTTTALSIKSSTSTALSVTVPSSLIAAAGTATVTVSNPGPGGGASSPVTFTIQ